MIDERQLASLEKLASGAPGMFDTILDEYLATADRTEREIQQALESGDARALERGAHSLKGSSGQMGAVALMAVCKELETAASRDDVKGCRLPLPRFTRDLTATRHILQGRRSGPSWPDPRGHDNGNEGNHHHAAKVAERAGTRPGGSAARRRSLDLHDSPGSRRRAWWREQAAIRGARRGGRRARAPGKSRKAEELLALQREGHAAFIDAGSSGGSQLVMERGQK